MVRKKLKNTLITLFVVLWTLLFHYESTRFFYLNPLLRRDLPQMKFLFPPAGWIMFFNVDAQFSYAQVYGVKNNEIQLIDAHQIFRTRPIGYDNIHRNVLITVLDQSLKEPFCRFLQYRYPDFDDFMITVVNYPSVTKTPFKRIQQIVYRCR